ncbi:MAG: hypothetical protein CW338_08150 [Clostridiales bacterium]|jgi:Acyl carrier protein|nr:hypothetical protein [Clostridiales bacterium]
MSHDEIVKEMRDILTGLRPDIDTAQTADSTRLADDLGMDSLTLLLMALKSEKVFGIRFENMQASSFATVGDVCRYIEGKLQ